ncbi:MAG TPA: T9SS type A sorting domain-containing protein [Bacteroidia bacterium]|nr:T9SS type A sorting domain-containing protein [Bacteroidia bacterium]
MKQIFTLRLLVLLGMVFSFQFSNAQCNTAGNGTNGNVHCLYTDSIHNCMYLGGGFQTSGMDTMNHCGYWNDSTYHPMNMMGHNGCNDSVWCFVMFNGDLYVGGNFTMAGGVPCNHIARWDGTSWFAVGDGFNEAVHALAVYNNQLYAGGEFTASGVTAINYMASWNGSQWNQVDGGMNDDVEVLCVWDSVLCIGGDFTMAGSITVNRICTWDGVSFAALGSGFTTGMMGSCMVHSLCVYNGNLYAGGMFEHASGHDMHNLGMWNGSAWSSVGDLDGSSMGENGVRTMCVYDGQLYVGGNFGSCGSVNANNLGCWNGSTWSSIGTGMNGEVKALAVYRNELYMAGNFSSAAGTAVNNIARYSANTGIQSVQTNGIYLSIYPNPATEFVQIKWENETAGSGTLVISDINGKIVFEQSTGILSPGSQLKHIAVKALSEGVYFLRLISGTVVSQVQFEKIK